jgi:hypothetical protein
MRDGKGASPGRVRPILKDIIEVDRSRPNGNA